MTRGANNSGGAAVRPLTLPPLAGGEARDPSTGAYPGGGPQSTTLPQLQMASPRGGAQTERAFPSPSGAPSASPLHTARGRIRGGGALGVQEFEAQLKSTYGRTLETLRIRDVHRNVDLRSELANFQLNEYFDDRGTPWFRKLSLAVAAKQHPHVEASFGSKTDGPLSPNGESRMQSVKAYFLAAEALEKDIEYRKRRNAEDLRAIDEKERHRVSDVQMRQLEVLFCEIPAFGRYLLPFCRQSDLLASDVSREEERFNRCAVDRSNGFLQDQRWVQGRQMLWMFTRPEVLYVAQIADLWMASHGAPAGCPGMDRPTFCRFILDLGLVDQDRVPYYWAVSLFDRAAKFTRCCPLEQLQWDIFVPVQLVISRWQLVAVLDKILQQHIGRESKHRFLMSLFPIARLRLPAHVIERSGLHDQTLKRLFLGEDTQSSAFSVTSAADSKAEQPPVATPDPDLNTTTSSKDSAAECASPLEMRCEELKRDHFVRSMLVEPEVLHVVSQYYDLFEHLQSSYADESGDMSFPLLLQFCTDFHITPYISSSNFLQRVYESTRSLQRAQAKDRVQTPMSQSTTSSRRTSPERSPQPRADHRKETPSKEASKRTRMSTTSVKYRRSKSPPSPLDTSSVRATQRKTIVRRMSSSMSESPVPALRSTRSLDTEKFKEWPHGLPWYGLAELTVKDALCTTPIKIMIIGAKGLRPTAQGVPGKFTDRADPYCVCEIPGKSGTKFQTKACNDTLEPVWNLRGEVVDYTPGNSIQFSVWDKGAKDKPELLGKAMLTSGQLHVGGFFTPAEFDGELPLSDSCGRGGRATLVVKVKQGDPMVGDTWLANNPAIFGVGAFAEALCRIAFTYLGYYGNTQQQATGGYARVMWLLTYLHSVFMHLRWSLEKRTAMPEGAGGGAEKQQLHPSLQKALLCTPLELWSSPSCPEEMLGTLPPTTCRPVLLNTETTPRKKTAQRLSPPQQLSALAAAAAARDNVSESGTTDSSCGSGISPGSGRRRAGSDKRKAAAPLQQQQLDSSDEGSPERVMQREASTRSLRKAATSEGESMWRNPSHGPRSIADSEAETGDAGSPSPSPKGTGQQLRRKRSVDKEQLPVQKMPTGPLMAKRGDQAGGRSQRRRDRSDRATIDLADAARATSQAAGPQVVEEDGQPCVANGVCRLCQSAAGPGQWGNARCRGCAVVDTVNFRQHLFRPLLIDWHPCVRPTAPVAEWPLKVVRSELTPPPVGPGGALRRKELSWAPGPA